MSRISQSRGKQRPRRRSSQSASQRYESLEQRRLLAGDVSVFHHESILYIRGDHSDNQIQITADEFGDVQVEGLGGTTINRGSDPYSIDTQNGRIDRGLRINMARGDDSVFIEDVNVVGGAVIYGGDGDDSVGLYQVEVDSLFAQTGRGDDLVSIDDVDVRGRLAVITAGGNDTVGIDQSLIDGETLVLTGQGDDDLAISNSTHNGNAYVFTYGGNDFVGVDNLTVNGLTSVVTGFGSDDVYVNDSNLNGRTYANGGFRSADNLEIDGDTTFAATPRVVGFEGSDVAGGKIQAAQVYTDLIVDGARLGTITELASITPQLSTLVGALQATGLDSALNGAGPFTVFAPLNSGFESIAGVVDSLTLEQLSQVLQFHVTTGEVFASELVTLDSVNTLLGQSFTVDLSSGDVVLNGNATLAATDIRAKNGVIHLLNDVLVPML